VIRQHPTARRLYADRLIAAGVLTDADAQAMLEQYRSGLDEGRPQARASLGMIRQQVHGGLERLRAG